jgi:hypothetical protein
VEFGGWIHGRFGSSASGIPNGSPHDVTRGYCADSSQHRIYILIELGQFEPLERLMAGVFDDDALDDIAYDDVLDDRSAVKGGVEDAAEGGLTKEMQEANANLAALGTKTAKKRRAPFNEVHIASSRGLGLLQEMAWEALRGNGGPLRIRTEKGYQALGMADAVLLWRSWARASYPGMTLEDMIPRLATLSGKSQVKGAVAAMRQQDRHMHDKELLRPQEIPEHKSDSDPDEYEALVRLAEAPGRDEDRNPSSSVRAGHTNVFDDEEEEDYAALGVDLDEYQ